MRNQIERAFIFLLLLSLISSAPLLSYDPTTGTSTVTLLSKSQNSFKWLYKRFTSSTYSIESVSLDMESSNPSNKVSTVAYDAATDDFTMKAVSQSYTCALLVQGTAKLAAVKFSPTASLQEDLIASAFIASGSEAAGVAKTYQIADSCTALCVDGGVTYHYDSTAAGTTKFIADTAATWTAPAFTGDFSFAAANQGLFAYTPKAISAPGFYTKVFDIVIYPNKKVWSTAIGIAVFSWESTGTNNIKNYKLHSIARPISGQNVYSLVGTIQGQFYEPNAGSPPKIAFSNQLEVISVYGSSSASAFFAKTKKFNYAMKTSSNINLPTWVTSSQSKISISRNYIYIRNSVNHGAFSVDIFGQSLYVAPFALTNAQKNNNYMKSLLEEHPSGELFVVREHNSLSNGLGILTLEPTVFPPTSQFFKWDRKGGVPDAEYEGPGTYYAQVDGKPSWFAQTIKSPSEKIFSSVTIDPITNGRFTASLETTQHHSLKVLSKNLVCAAIYDSSSSGTLKIFEFRPRSTTVTVVGFRTVAAPLYSGITLTDPSTKFDVSDDCNAVRINNVLLHWNQALNSNVGGYAADTVPSGMNLVNPVCSADLSVIVTQNGIYSYTTTTKTYNLARTEAFYESKNVWKMGNNLVIFTWQPQTTGNNYNFKLQFNAIQSGNPSVITKFNQTSAQSYIFPWISISNRLTKVIVGGFDVSDNTKVKYFGINVNWAGRTTRNMSLPPVITNSLSMFAISEDFLYVRNFQTETPKQLGFALIGSNLVEAFNQNARVSSQGYSRSFLIPDADNAGRMIIVHQYTNKQFIRLTKDLKKNSQQILNPNQVPPFEMTFSYGTNSINRLSAPSFGRWIWSETSGSTLKWLEYDPSQTEKKKVITQTSLTTGSDIVAISRSFDCVISMLTSGNTFDTIRFDNRNAGSASKTNHWATVVADTSAPQIDNAAVNQIKAGDGCWAFRINGLVYVKPSGAGAYVKSAISASDFSNAIFDDSLKFAIVPSTGKVYKYGTNDYVNILNVTGLKTRTFIYSSPDSNRIIIFSYNNTITGQSVPYETVIRIYVSDGTNYNQVTLPNNGEFTTRSTEARMYFDLAFNTIVVGYSTGTNQNQSVSINVVNVDYNTRTIENYEVPSVWYTWNEPNFFIFGDLIYCMQPTSSSSSDGTEFFFKLDKENLKIVQFGRRQVNPEQFSTFRGGDIVQQNNLIYVLYESEPTGAPAGTVRIMKRGVGSPALQNKIRDIQIQDTGFVVQNGQIRLCSPGCNFCVNPTTCSACSNGYVLNSVTSNCLRCGPLCETCTQSDPSTCATCVPGFYAQGSGSNTVCRRCHDSCVTCSGLSASDCTSCKIGLYLDTNTNSCTQCINNCISCTSGAANLCDVCKPGFVYNDQSKRCVKCIAGCSICNPAQVYSCVSCGVGFEPIMNTANVISQCKVCPPRCKNCTNGNCIECRNGFRLVNNNCTEQCRLPCKQCTEQKADSCTSCLGGYSLEADGVCAPNLSCNSDLSCTSCPIGYNLVGGQCKQCNGGPNCRTCDNIDVDKCASCRRGFYLTETITCARCNITGCAACNNPVYCSECRPGFILAGTGQSAKCTKCADRCATCFESPNNCDLCAPGFTKKGWSCISNINVQLTLILNGDFSTFTTDQFEAIQQAIAALIGKDRAEITVNELRSGSILIDATINSDNSAQQSSMMELLQTSLSTGSDLAGFSVQSAGIVANSDVKMQDDSEAMRYRNIAIIVGVVIPIGLIIIFIVLVLLYKKGIIFNSNQSTHIRDATLNEIQLQDPKSLQ